MIVNNSVATKLSYITYIPFYTHHRNYTIVRTYQSHTLWVVCDDLGAQIYGLGSVEMRAYDPLIIMQSLLYEGLPLGGSDRFTLGVPRGAVQYFVG